MPLWTLKPGLTGERGGCEVAEIKLTRGKQRWTTMILQVLRSCESNCVIFKSFGDELLTHWGRVTHICVNNLTIIGPDNGLSPGRRQAIVWTNACMLLIGPLGTNFNEILLEIHTFSFKNIYFKMSSGKCRPFCLGLNVLTLHTELLLGRWYYREPLYFTLFVSSQTAVVEVCSG